MREEEIQQLLLTFLENFTEYANEVHNEHRTQTLLELRTKLQRLEPTITPLLIEDQGYALLGLEHIGRVQLQSLLMLAVAGGNNEDIVNFYVFETAVNSAINHALGRLEAGLWPKKEPEPVLLIHDEELRNRCTDLLKAPGYYDRVVREATIILEDRIRQKLSHGTLSCLIPNSSDQQGRNLIDKLLNPNSPIISVNSDKNIRVKFRDILIGVVSYLRNPYHHHLDDHTEWSWAWSTVGFIDGLLNEIDHCTLSE